MGGTLGGGAEMVGSESQKAGKEREASKAGKHVRLTSVNSLLGVWYYVASRKARWPDYGQASMGLVGRGALLDWAPHGRPCVLMGSARHRSTESVGTQAVGQTTDCEDGYQSPCTQVLARDTG